MPLHRSAAVQVATATDTHSEYVTPTVFFTTTMVTRTRLNVTLQDHCPTHFYAHTMHFYCLLFIISTNRRTHTHFGYYYNIIIIIIIARHVTILNFIMHSVLYSILWYTL